MIVPMVPESLVGKTPWSIVILSVRYALFSLAAGMTHVAATLLFFS